MTTSDIVRVGMPLDEFMRLGRKQSFELINGEKIYKAVTGLGHSEAIRLLFRSLDGYALSNGGEAYSETTFILPDMVDETDRVTGSRIPDLMYFAGTRVADYKKAHPQHINRPIALIPDFVIEIISPTDIYTKLDEKIDAYLADGVRLIWVIDPQRRKAVVYAADKEQPYHLRSDGVLDGEDVLPDFRIQLSQLFAG
jgi:Uma2 family endonuclease